MTARLTLPSGDVLWPSSDAYEARPPVFDGRHALDRPRLIARCVDIEDVQATLAFAADASVELTVRSGAHSLPGYSTIRDGLVLDVGLMCAVDIDVAAARATIGPGVLSRSLLPRTIRAGLVPITGYSVKPSVVGFAVHGGRGFLGRRYGWASDHVRSAEVVTASGDVITTSATERPDLLYGLRGAGSNFGVITKLEIDLVPIASAIVAGELSFRGRAVGRVVAALGELLDGELSDALGLALTFFVDAGGQPNLTIDCVHVGDASSVARDLSRLRGIAPPVQDSVARCGYDAFLLERPTGSDQPDARYFWAEQGCDDVSTMFSELLLEELARLPATVDEARSQKTITIDPFGPGYAREPDLATPVPRRRGVSVTYAAKWFDRARDDEHVAWARDGWQRFLDAGVGSGVPTLNYNSAADRDAVRQAYGAAAYARLQDVKRAYDPDNTFARNHNVRLSD